MEQTTEFPQIKDWSLLHKLSFRFLFVFIILMTSIWEMVPFLEKVFSSFHYTVSFWVQNNILHRSALYHQPTGSGDTFDDWILFFSWITIALLVTILWTLLNRKRKEYVKLENILRVMTRLYVAAMMLSYGFSKVFVQQMPPPTLYQLYSPLGHLSPMRLSWLFIGYSAPYEIFSGLMEVLGAIFLLWRRTTAIGAFLLVCVMTNVAMMNFSYDIPVKLYSCFVLFLCLYLLSFDFTRIYRFVILRKVTDPEPFIAIKTKRQKYSWAVLAVGIVFFYGFFPAYIGSGMRQEYQSHHPKYFGSYDVIEYSFADSTYNSATSEDRWNQIVIGEGNENRGYVGFVRKGLHKLDYGTFSFNGDEGIHINLPRDNQNNYFEIEHKDSVTMQLTMTNGPIITKMLVKKNDEFMPLTKKPFHWVSATAY